MKAKQADILGIISAGLCIIHCLMVPLFVLYGVLSDSFGERWEYLDWGFIAISSAAVYLATRHESNPLLAALLWGTLSVFTVALLLHDLWPPALYISVIASLGLATLHLFHFRSKRHRSYSHA